MPSAFAIRYGMIRGLFALGAVAIASGTQAFAQTATTSTNDGWQRYDWLSPSADPATSGTVKTSSTQDIKDPFAVVTTGALWQEKNDTIYTRRVADSLSLSYETSSTLLNEASSPALPLAGGTPDGLGRGQQVGLQFQPVDQVSVGSNVHASTTDAAIPGDTVMTSGAGFSAQAKLPTNSVLIFGANTDRTAADATGASVTTTTAYDAQISQPLGNLPLSAQLKGHYEETQVTGSPLGKMPTLEQSVTWKPAETTTVQMGLRQQQYQEYPGVDNQFNAAIFADFSQKVVNNVTWHSYGELLNTRGLVDQAPASPLASGANGTAQATTPTDNVNPASSVPLSMQDQTLTLSTGPSFQLQKDISASVEYSNRWDKNPAPGAIGQEQRVSLSVKGSF